MLENIFQNNKYKVFINSYDKFYKIQSSEHPVVLKEFNSFVEFPCFHWQFYL